MEGKGGERDASSNRSLVSSRFVSSPPAPRPSNTLLEKKRIPPTHIITTNTPPRRQRIERHPHPLPHPRFQESQQRRIILRHHHMPHDSFRRPVLEVVQDGLAGWVGSVGRGEEEREDVRETGLEPVEGWEFFPQGRGTKDVDVGEEMEGCERTGSGWDGLVGREGREKVRT